MMLHLYTLSHACLQMVKTSLHVQNLSHSSPLTQRLVSVYSLLIITSKRVEIGLFKAPPHLPVAALDGVNTKPW